jgi:hypothetical protein
MLKSSNEIIHKQGENLKLLIKEARHAEADRLHRLELAADEWRKRELEKRFETERHLDREKIERMRADFEGLKAAVERGDVNISARVYSSPRKLEMDSNRFSGLESEIDILFHRSVCNKIEKLNAKHEASMNRANFKAMEEYKKVNHLFMNLSSFVLVS